MLCCATRVWLEASDKYALHNWTRPMKSSALCFSKSKVLLALVLAGVTMTSMQVKAQQVYRIVGPDGRLTFSDRPPPALVPNSSISETNAIGGTGNPAPVGLPFVLRQVALKYPVVLYTGDNCAPCGAGRSLLTGRGIPFSEKTVTTAADSEALRRLSGEMSLPLLTIGNQQLKGFSDVEWTQFLNAAGYPGSSILLSGYRVPVSVPLVAETPLLASSPSGESNEPKVIKKILAPRPVKTPADSSNPAGIKF